MPFQCESKSNKDVLKIKPPELENSTSKLRCKNIEKNDFGNGEIVVKEECQ